MTRCPTCGQSTVPLKGLTARQRQVQLIIQASIEARGFSPTTREIMNETGHKSSQNIARILDGLEERGYISRIRYRARGVYPRRWIEPTEGEAA